MINIIATAASTKQAEALLKVGVDTLYIGDNRFGLRLPTSMSIEEIEEVVKLAHHFGKKVHVAVNGIMHNEHIEELPKYLHDLHTAGIDAITVGDPGVIMLLKELNLEIPYIYDAHTLVTSASQIQFWLKKGAIGAIVARELTFIELKTIQEKLLKPIEVQVYGPTCIHHSKRSLLTNYYQFADVHGKSSTVRGTNISEQNDAEHQYSIYEDENGTHIFSAEDISLLPYFPQLYQARIVNWKMDGLFLPEDTFTSIVQLFVQAKRELLSGNAAMEEYVAQLERLQPKERAIGTGFFLKQPDEVQ
ncbi:MAG: U32 family peptidase [Bacillus sp. (in: Bacteria)]|nr:U32 family peptidase [Bacillus sp. (in: firmicutes)]